jgi:hypothetical protein
MPATHQCPVGKWIAGSNGMGSMAISSRLGRLVVIKIREVIPQTSCHLTGGDHPVGYKKTGKDDFLFPMYL